MYALGCHILTRRRVQPGETVAILGAGKLGLSVLDVLCHSANPATETDDTTIVQMRMQSGALVSFTSTRRTPIVTNELDILGTEGRLLAGPLSEGRLVLHRRGRTPETLNYPRRGVMHTELLATIVPILQRGEPSPVPEDAVAVWKIMEAAYRSAEEGVRVTVK